MRGTLRSTIKTLEGHYALCFRGPILNVVIGDNAGEWRVATTLEGDVQLNCFAVCYMYYAPSGLRVLLPPQRVYLEPTGLLLTLDFWLSLTSDAPAFNHSTTH